MLGILQLATSPVSILTGLLAGGAIGASARRPRGSGTADVVGASRSTQSAAKGFALSPTSEILVARPRGGRLPLPESVATLTPTDEPALLLVNAFVDRLSDLTLAEWLDVGRRVMADQDALARRSTSWAIMDATIAHRQLGLAAWYVRDAVETVAYLANYSAVRPPRSHRRIFAAAHGSAEDAALAVLVREHLSAEDFTTLCAPFAT
jgi:hypothetical protein